MKIVQMTMKTYNTQLCGKAFALYIYILTMSSGRTYGFTVELIPRTSIDSVLFPKGLALEEIHQRIADLSRVRAFHLGSMTFAKSSQKEMNTVPETLKPPVFSSPFAILYMTKISIGTGQFSPYMVVDTGADDTWLQCEGCRNCFPIKGGSFSASQSKTYRGLTCEHPLCLPKSCYKNVCLYNWMYREASITKGVLSAESFTFQGDNSSGITFPTLIFGCGYDNQNITFGGYMDHENVIAGVFGLGAGRRSILKQLEPQTNLRFAYCLPSWTGQPGVNTFLRFGPDAQISGDDKRKVQTIKLIPGMARYYVNVTGIGLDGKRLNIDPTLFVLTKGGSGGFAIDSGVGPTLLVPDAYKVLRTEMIKYVFRYGWHPAEGKDLPYDLCFKVVPATNNKIPSTSMAIHLQGADLSLQSNSIFEQIGNLLCMIFLPTSSSGPSLLGAFQQANNHFLFDVRKSTVSFVPESCHEK